LVERTKTPQEDSSALLEVGTHLQEEKLSPPVRGAPARDAATGLRPIRPPGPNGRSPFDRGSRSFDPSPKKSDSLPTRIGALVGSLSASSFLANEIASSADFAKTSFSDLRIFPICERAKSFSISSDLIRSDCVLRAAKVHRISSRDPHSLENQIRRFQLFKIRNPRSPSPLDPRLPPNSKIPISANGFPTIHLVRGPHPSRPGSPLRRPPISSHSSPPHGTPCPPDLSIYPQPPRLGIMGVN